MNEKLFPFTFIITILTAIYIRHKNPFSLKIELM